MLRGRSLIVSLANLARLLFWLLLISVLISPWLGGGSLSNKRTALLEAIQKARQSRVITLLHREETVSLFGIPVNTYIDIDDSEAILRAIRLTPPDTPIDLILHTPGGLVLAASQIAHALHGHKGKVTVFVPHYAMSGGTLLALAADEIVMDANAVLGPVDPQIGDLPAASILKAVKAKPVEHLDDQTLILADISAKAIEQVTALVTSLLKERFPADKVKAFAEMIATGQFTHDFPITVERARALGLTISTDMPQTIYQLMDLYPQGGGGRPSVSYVPLASETFVPIEAGRDR